VVAQVVPDEGFEAVVDRWARRLARGAPLAFAATKKAVNAATLAGLDEAFARERSGQSVLLRTDDVAEGMRAFLDKRRPEFRGR
jgi:enoyl-CoA hydratase